MLLLLKVSREIVRSSRLAGAGGRQCVRMARPAACTSGIVALVTPDNPKSSLEDATLACTCDCAVNERSVSKMYS